MEGQCQCGSVRFTTPTPKPLKMYFCHCLECRRQSASAFGISAIFPAFEIPSTVTDIGVYTHSNTTSGREKKCYFCKKCGTRVMHGGKDYVAVKGGCLDALDKDLLDSATHIWTKRAIVPIPDGVESYPEEPP
ncbi:uncharacterized protein Z518_03146 [Rhinocladiella mackenziei CBS 650.93]|uniref:CENP-V/GFA domain-containing protein n=1 Tax=Rhinocladiella mackenziei CBS 650.93 TaxID=1442369 RepID=A0A0D2JGQ3_9EURO|nr:uncharacterized protein Z518_03146 [Rhinocladiella mackenziei CBS 650.93]KIX08490.1 hypothetical protein Z518_03146 [Rhinocladiella mackenziei CBS 650.93]